MIKLKSENNDVFTKILVAQKIGLFDLFLCQRCMAIICYKKIKFKYHITSSNVFVDSSK